MRSAPEGANFETEQQDWTLALVRRELPTEDGVTTWDKKVVLYHFSASEQTLRRSVISAENWPSGVPPLDGKEPPALVAAQFLASSSPATGLDHVTAADWTSLKQPLDLTLQPAGMTPLRFQRDFSSYLATP